MSAIGQRTHGVWIGSTVTCPTDIHVKALMELFNTGATIVNVHSGQADQKHVIEFYGKHVLPRVHKQLNEA